MDLGQQVLIIDDEPRNVEALLDYFERCNISHDYADSLQGGVEHLVLAERYATGYQLVILDNHFEENPFSLPDQEFLGLDLANILVGNEQNFTTLHLDFIRDHFSDYASLKAHYEGRVIMFSGSADEDREDRPEMFTGIAVAEKRMDHEGSVCEDSVIEEMKQRGFVFSKKPATVRIYKEQHDLSAGVDIESPHEQAVYKFFQEKGLSSQEMNEYVLQGL